MLKFAFKSYNLYKCFRRENGVMFKPVYPVLTKLPKPCWSQWPWNSRGSKWWCSRLSSCFSSIGDCTFCRRHSGTVKCASRNNIHNSYNTYRNLINKCSVIKWFQWIEVIKVLFSHSMFKNNSYSLANECNRMTTSISNEVTYYVN